MIRECWKGFFRQCSWRRVLRGDNWAETKMMRKSHDPNVESKRGSEVGRCLANSGNRKKACGWKIYSLHNIYLGTFVCQTCGKKGIHTSVPSLLYNSEANEEVSVAGFKNGQFFIPTCVHTLYNMTLQLLFSRGRCYYPISWIWYGLWLVFGW